MQEEYIQDLIKTIQQKKELAALSEDFIKDRLLLFFKRESKTAKALQENFNPRSSFYKKAVKSVRADLRRWHGLYHQNKSKIEELLQLLRDDSKQRTNLITQILEEHTSTKERLSIYPQLYKNIFSITGKPKSIIDIGCGLNPFSISFMNLKSLTYFAYDINQQEMSYVQEFFLLIEAKELHGKAIVSDLLKEKNYLSADIAFLFKVTDLIDQGKGHKNTEEFILQLPVKYVVISFPTKTMSGKPMTAPRRKWMEWLCTRLEFEYKILKFENEIFYVVKKT